MNLLGPSLALRLVQTVKTQLEMIQELEMNLVSVEEIFDEHPPDDLENLLPSLIELFTDVSSDIDEGVLRKGLSYTLEGHLNNDPRDSGHPYAAHSVQTGLSMAHWGFKSKGITIMLFHDLIEKNPKRMIDILNHVYTNYGSIEAMHLLALSNVEPDSEKRHNETFVKLSQYIDTFKLDYAKPGKFADGTVNIRDIHLLKGTEDETAYERKKRNIDSKEKGLMPIAEELDKNDSLPMKVVPYLESLVAKQRKLLYSDE